MTFVAAAPLWRYLVTSHGRALYIGQSKTVADSLLTHCGALDWVYSADRPAPAHQVQPPGVTYWESLDGARTAVEVFEIVVVDDSVDEGSRAGRTVSAELVAKAAHLVSDSGVLVVRVILPPVYMRFFKKPSLDQLRATVRRSGFAVGELFWFRDGFEQHNLYAITRLGNRPRPPKDECSKIVWCLRPRALALTAVRSAVKPPLRSGGGPSVEKGWLITESGSERIRSVWRGSGMVHRVETGRSITRIPFDSRSVERCHNNHRTLQAVAGLGVSFSTPTARRAFTYKGLPCYTETRIKGQSRDAFRVFDVTRRRRKQAAIDAIIDLQRASGRRIVVDDELFQRLIQNPSSTLKPLLPLTVRRAVDEFEAAIRPCLLGRPLTIVCVHGDFKGANLLWSDEGHVCGVVDWDLSVPSYLPVIDYAFYSAYDRSTHESVSFDEALAREAIPEPGCRYWQFAAHELATTRTIYASCVVMALIRYAIYHAGFLEFAQHSAWCERNVNRGLQLACDDTARLARSSL